LPRTFICYASADRLFLSREIIPLLNRHGIETWFSGEDIRTADEWEQSIRRGLEECDWFVVALSPRALESHWVRAEVHWAVDRRQGRVVPILLEACDPIALHLKLSQIQYVDFTTPSDSARRKMLASWGIAYQPLPRTAVESAQRMREAIASLRGHSLIKTLGCGSTAHVFLARCEARGLVAIKVLDTDLGPDYVTAALQAVRDMERIHYPAVIPYTRWVRWMNSSTSSWNMQMAQHSWR
jgi:hypothetical protein